MQREMLLGKELYKYRAELLGDDGELLEAIEEEILARVTDATNVAYRRAVNVFQPTIGCSVTVLSVERVR